MEDEVVVHRHGDGTVIVSVLIGSEQIYQLRNGDGAVMFQARDLSVVSQFLDPSRGGSRSSA